MKVIFAADGIDEALHVEFDVKAEVVRRWSVYENVTGEIFGTAGDGTSIDLEEPFVIRLVKRLNVFVGTCRDVYVYTGLAVMKMAGWLKSMTSPPTLISFTRCQWPTSRNWRYPAKQTLAMLGSDPRTLHLHHQWVSTSPLCALRVR